MSFTNASTGFQNPVIGGNGELVIDDIHSRIYTPGVAGWSINRDGSAEFNDVTVRGIFEVIQLPGGGYMKMIPLQFSPGLVWNSTPSVFTKNGSLQVETIGLGLRATTRITTPSGTTIPTVDPEISITSGDTGTTGAGGIGLTAGAVTLTADNINDILPSTGDVRIQTGAAGPINFIKLNALEVQISEGPLRFGGTLVTRQQRGKETMVFNGATSSIVATVTFPVVFSSVPFIWMTLESANNPQRFVYKIRGAPTTADFVISVISADGAVVAAQNVIVHWHAEN